MIDEYSKYDLTEEVGRTNYKLNEEKQMMSGFFKLNLSDVTYAVVLAVVVAVAGYVLKVGDVFALDYHALVNAAVMSGVGSLLTSLLTTKEGKFAGVVPVE